MPGSNASTSKFPRHVARAGNQERLDIGGGQQDRQPVGRDAEDVLVGREQNLAAGERALGDDELIVHLGVRQKVARPDLRGDALGDAVADGN
jgi:hypothetical protein